MRRAFLVLPMVLSALLATGVETSVMTFNIWGDYFGNPVHERDAKEVGVILRYRPDIVALQEVTPNFWKSRLFTDLPAAGYGVVRGDEPEAIRRAGGKGTEGFVNHVPLLYRKDRFDCLAFGYEIFHLALTDNKGVTWAVLRDKRDDSRLIAFSTHFWYQENGPESDAIRELNARHCVALFARLKEKYGDFPVVGGGDLNSLVGSIAHRTFNLAGYRNAQEIAADRDRISSWHQDPVRDAQGVYRGRQRAKNNVHATSLDHVFVEAAKLKVLKHRVIVDPDALDVSDHSPVLAVVIPGRTEPAPVPPTKGFAWRGYMLDCSRHFFTVKEIEKTLDTMAAHGLNVLHWHLVDGAGWRLQIDRYPLLTEKGAVRPSNFGVRRTNKYMHDAFETSEGKYGPYFYTKDDVREIVWYAGERGIRVVPEIEIPGHEDAAIRCYPFLRCPKGGCEICIGSGQAIEFFEHVLDEVVELFPDEVVHIGGDECNADAWRQCPKCQAKLAALGTDDVQQLRHWVTKHFADYLARKGRRIMGWGDIFGGKDLPKSAIVQVWDKRSVATEATAAGYDIVYSFCAEAYLDYDQGLVGDRHEYPSFAGRMTCEQVYRNFDPVRGVAPEHRQHVLGGEGCAWTENIADQDELEFKSWPRMAILADLLNEPQMRESRDWKAYLPRLERHRENLLKDGVKAAPLGPLSDGSLPGLDPKPRRISFWNGSTCPVFGPKVTEKTEQLDFVNDAGIRPGGYALKMTWRKVTIRVSDAAGRARAVEMLNRIAIPKDEGRVLYLPNVEIED